MNASKQYTKLNRWEHIGKRSSNGGMFLPFKRAFKKQANNAFRRAAKREMLLQLQAEREMHEEDIQLSLLSWWGLDDFDDDYLMGVPDEHYDEGYDDYDLMHGMPDEWSGLPW